ncbi:MAG: hypothetical protein ACLGI9_17410 [Thermoanaerobaculia bacterium]
MSFRYSDLLVDVWASNGCPDPSRPPCPAPSKPPQCPDPSRAQCPDPSRSGGAVTWESLLALRHQLRQSLAGAQARS